MERDRSLEEFVGDAAAESEADDPETESAADAEAVSRDDEAETESGDDETEADTETRSDDVQPATATYRWDPDGVECPACGNVADRLWSQDGRHVCADCKDW